MISTRKSRILPDSEFVGQRQDISQTLALPAAAALLLLAAVRTELVNRSIRIQTLQFRSTGKALRYRSFFIISAQLGALR